MMNRYDTFCKSLDVELSQFAHNREVNLSILIMHKDLVSLTCEVELQPGKFLTLPPEFTTHFGAGRWLITIQAVPSPSPLRNHAAFLNSFSAEDEGLYDDYAR